MKAVSWKLPAGMVLGLAGGFLLRPVVMTDRGDLRWFDGPGATEANATGSEALSGKSTASSFGKRPAGSPLARLSSGDAVEDVRDLIGMVDVDRDPINHINLMELIRRVYLLTQLRESEVVEVLSDLSKEEDGLDPLEMKKMAGVIALTRLAELNGPEALRLMSSEDLDFISDDSEDWLSVMVMNSWVAADPEGAKRWFEAGMMQLDQEEMRDLMESDDFRQSYYDGMAKHDPEALAREIGYDSDPDKRDEVMVALVRNTKDPAELVGLLGRCTGVSDARSEAIDKLSESDPLAAAAWVEKQGADEARDNDITTVASAMMERESGKGIEWYMAQKFADGGREGGRLSQIADHLADGDLEKAAEWVESRPDDAARDSAEIALARRFARTDPDEAMDWLKRVEDSATRDPALQEILHDRWDPLEDRLRDGVIEAAERAGMGEAAGNFKPKAD